VIEKEAIMLSGRTALLTGSTSGLGIARALAADGADVLPKGFGDPALIDDLLDECESQYMVEAAYSPADMSKPADVAATVVQALGALRGPDILATKPHKLALWRYWPLPSNGDLASAQYYSRPIGEMP
jgi:NAD(P)-dependent dehydrogenase (short-subunit alcohol dehydrogenase family)